MTRKSKAEKSDDNSNKPWVSNYPPLQEWLEKIGAHCVDQIAIGDADAPIAYLEKWLANGQMLLVEVRSNGNGWNLYTAPQTLRIDETLADAERRLGIDLLPIANAQGSEA